jgi:hypothetical protein
VPVLTFPKSSLGAIVDATLAPSDGALQLLSQAGRPQPTPTQIKFLIDTGGESTAIDEALIDKWGLPYVKAGFVATMTGSKPVRYYDLRLRFAAANGQEVCTFEPIVIMARRSPFEGMPYSGLIGRDILDRVVFTYDGRGHRCSIDF